MSRASRLTLLLALPLLVFGALLAVLWGGLGQNPRLLPSALVNHPLPNFSEPLLGDPQKKITAHDLEGKVALLNVWATWCPTCRAEHAFLRTLKKQGVIIYGINYKDSPQKAQAWLATLGNPYQLTIEDSSGQLGLNLGVYGAPETFLLDTHGVIRYRHVGALDARSWKSEFVPRIKQLKSRS